MKKTNKSFDFQERDNTITQTERAKGKRGKMIDKPLYKYVPTFRNYEDYHDAEQYVKGWNDAMKYIFPESKKAMEKLPALRFSRKSCNYQEHETKSQEHNSYT